MIPFGAYELLALLAEGGVAEIWLARQRGPSGFERLLVVKRLLEHLAKDPEYLDMFLDEARINARLQHTNVLSTYELGEVEGRYFLAMEYVEGLPLGVLAQRTIERLSDVPINLAGGLIVQAAHGLHYAHEALAVDGSPLQVVHRDVSPLNLIVSFEGVVKVADFGVAKAAGRRTRTRSGLVKGTPTYMAPEQAAGGVVDRRTDVFALGILLWELLTSRRLFKRSTAEETYDAIVSGDIPPPSVYRPELPASLDAITIRALQRRPQDRFPTAASFADELDRALHAEALRAEVVDVRAFMAEHFASERESQEALVRRVQHELDQGEHGAPTPLFRHAEHGLDSGDGAEADAEEFQDGPTTEDAVDVGSATDAAATSPATRAPKPAAPPSKGSSTTLIVILVLVALAVALTLGLLLGRTQR